MAVSTLPGAPTSTPAPVSLPTTLIGQIKQQLASGVNAGGQPLSAAQKANLTSQLAQATGKTTYAQAQAARTTATGDALKSSTTMNNYTFTDPADTAAQTALNTQYGLPATAGLTGTQIAPQATPIARDPAREAETMKKAGGAPTNEQEAALVMLSTYKPEELTAMGYDPTQLKSVAYPQTNQAATWTNPDGVPSNPYDAAKLKELGLSDEQIAKLGTVGTDANSMAGAMNAAQKPTNSGLHVLEAALRAKYDPASEPLVDPNFLKLGQAGYGILAQSLQQRSTEMSNTFSGFMNTLKDVAGTEIDAYNAVSTRYQNTMAEYDKQTQRLLDINKAATEYENQMKILDKQHQNDLETQNMANQFQTGRDETAFENQQTLAYINAGYDLQVAEAKAKIDAEAAAKTATDKAPTTITDADGDPAYWDATTHTFKKVVIAEGDTPTNLTNTLTQNAPAVGGDGGECGTFSRKNAGVAVGDSYESKQAVVDAAPLSAPIPGAVFVMPIPDKKYAANGHIGIVAATGTDSGGAYIMAYDSNYVGHHTVGLHKIYQNKIYGYTAPKSGAALVAYTAAKAFNSSTGNTKDKLVSGLVGGVMGAAKNLFAPNKTVTTQAVTPAAVAPVSKALQMVELGYKDHQQLYNRIIREQGKTL